MRFYEQYRFCPVCGVQYSDGAFDADSNSFVCPCGYRFYQNSKPSASAVIPSPQDPTQVLMLTRAIEPGIGRLALPGGFLNYGEDPHNAIEREAFEETSLDVRVDRLLCCTMVDYVWCGADLSVVEMGFLMSPAQTSSTSLWSGEASSMAYYEIDELIPHPERLAFPTHAHVLACYRAGMKPALSAKAGCTASPLS